MFTTTLKEVKPEKKMKQSIESNVYDLFKKGEPSGNKKLLGDEIKHKSIDE